MRARIVSKVFTRRTMAPLLAVLLSLLVVAPALAGRVWCRRDPVFFVAGVQVNVEAAIPQENERNVNGPLKVMLAVPPNVKATLEQVDVGFNGHSEEVMIVSSRKLSVSKTSVQIAVTVLVPADRGDIPVMVYVSRPKVKTATASGKVNQELTVVTTVPISP